MRIEEINDKEDICKQLNEVNIKYKERGVELERLKEEVNGIDRQYNESHLEGIKKDEEMKELHVTNTDLKEQLEETKEYYLRQIGDLKKESKTKDAEIYKLKEEIK